MDFMPRHAPVVKVIFTTIIKDSTASPRRWKLQTKVPDTGRLGTATTLGVNRLILDAVG